MLSQTILLSLALAMAPTLAGAPVTTQDLLGVWLTDDGLMAVEIAPCDEALCGTVVWLAQGADESLALGDVVLSGLSPDPNAKGAWSGGKVYCPTAEKHYYKTQLSFENSDRIEFKGFAGVMHNGRVVTSRFDTRLHWNRSSREALTGR